GQGACMAIEDAMSLAQCLGQYDTVEKAVQAFDSWSHWARCASLVLISRYCGQFYTSNNDAARKTLTFCLSYPFNLLFVLVIKIILFTWMRGLRAYADTMIGGKKKQL